MSHRNRFPHPLLAALVAIGLVLSAVPAVAGPLDNLRTVSGKVVAVDKEAKTVTVDQALGKVVVVHMDDSTKVEGGDLQVGQSVRVNTTEKDGVRLATSIKIRG